MAGPGRAVATASSGGGSFQSALRTRGKSAWAATHSARPLMMACRRLISRRTIRHSSVERDRLPFLGLRSIHTQVQRLIEREDMIADHRGNARASRPQQRQRLSPSCMPVARPARPRLGVASAVLSIIASSQSTSAFSASIRAPLPHVAHVASTSPVPKCAAVDERLLLLAQPAARPLALDEDRPAASGKTPVTIGLTPLRPTKLLPGSGLILPS